MTYPPPPNKIRSTTGKLSGNFYEAIIAPDGEILNPFDEVQSAVFLDLVEEAASENHSPEWQYLKGSEYDIGGDFFVFRNKASNVGYPFSYFDTGPWFIPGYTLVFSASGTLTHLPMSQMPYPEPINSTESQMNMRGAECVAKAAPGKSPAELATALGELKKDGIPAVISTFQGRNNVAKKAGDSYLNAEFGWKPLVRDVTSVASTISNSGSLLSQLERDAGRRVRRRITLLDETETEELNLGPFRPRCLNISTDHFASKYKSSNLRLTITKSRKIWFSGSFTYYLPKDYYSRNKFMRATAKANVLLGLELTPSVMWNLAPWSWAADWFSNAGEVISNTERMLSGGLVMHHGYVMEHTTHLHTYSFDNDSIPPASLLTETKGRMKANPFGFGVEWPDLSGFQLSIISALGMSKSR